MPPLERSERPLDGLVRGAQARDDRLRAAPSHSQVQGNRSVPTMSIGGSGGQTTEEVLEGREGIDVLLLSPALWGRKGASDQSSEGWSAPRN